MSVYIKGIGAITIQNTLSKEWFSARPLSYDTQYVRCIEPKFNDFLNPLEARRMSRIIKRAIISSQIAINESGIYMPDIIISGTGLGAVEDTEKFLNAMTVNGENCLQPSFFIQSTHNSISSQIAIKIKCNGFNNTHVHRGVSFDSALEEGIILLENGSGKTALIGGYDELTPDYFKMLGRLKYWRKEINNTIDIIENPGTGSFSGEGSISIMLSKERKQDDYCEIAGCELFYKPCNLNNTIEDFLSRHGVKKSDVDLFMLGKNGDAANDSIYDNLYPDDKTACYKHICGEYFTSSSFAVMSAAYMLKNGNVPGWYGKNRQEIKNITTILIHNHAFNKNHSLILLKKC